MIKELNTEIVRSSLTNWQVSPRAVKIKIMSCVKIMYLWCWMIKAHVIHNKYQQGKYILGLQWQNPLIIKCHSARIPGSQTTHNSTYSRSNFKKLFGCSHFRCYWGVLWVPVLSDLLVSGVHNRRQESFFFSFNFFLFKFWKHSCSDRSDVMTWR
jgi:hypothetical protein